MAGYRSEERYLAELVVEITVPGITDVLVGGWEDGRTWQAFVAARDAPLAREGRENEEKNVGKKKLSAR